MQNTVQTQLKQNTVQIKSNTINELTTLQFQKKSCRICLTNQQQENGQLITPCKCSGSLEFVHKQCFYEWIKHLYQRLQTDSQKQNMQKQGFSCQICKTGIKAQFKSLRALVNKKQFKQICKDSIPLTFTIIIFFMIAIAAFSYLVYFADYTKEQFEKENLSQALFTVLGIIIVVLFFCAGMLFFIFNYIWISKIIVKKIITLY